MKARFEILGVLAMVIAIGGVLLNNRVCIWCFACWMLSNAINCFLHVRGRMWSLAFRDALFFALCIEGWWRWAT